MRNVRHMGERGAMGERHRGDRDPRWGGVVAERREVGATRGVGYE